MSERYIITGAQLGELTVYAKVGEEKEIKKVLKKIENEQFVENSKKLLSKDIKMYQNIKINKELQKSINEIKKIIMKINGTRNNS